MRVETYIELTLNYNQKHFNSIVIKKKKISSLIFMLFFQTMIFLHLNRNIFLKIFFLFNKQQIIYKKYQHTMKIKKKLY